MASSQPSDPSQRADNPPSSRHHGGKPQGQLRCHAHNFYKRSWVALNPRQSAKPRIHGSGSLSAALLLGCPARGSCHPGGPRQDGRNEPVPERLAPSSRRPPRTCDREFYHSRAQGCCGRASQGHRLRIGLCQLPSLRPAATAKLEPSVWSRRAIRHHHRNLRGCKTPAARRATGALLGEAVIDAAAGVQNQLLWRETWFSRPRRLLGRNEWSKPFAVRLG